MGTRESVAGTNIRPLGGFFSLGLLDVPPVRDSIYDAWTAQGHLALTAWTARAVLKKLFDAKRPDRIWLPAYACRQLAEAVPQLAVRFYPLGPELSPDIGYLQHQVRSGDLVLAIDYFGWPPGLEFRSWGAERPDVTWVEDRAQCLWMEAPPWAPLVSPSFFRTLLTCMSAKYEKNSV